MHYNYDSNDCALASESLRVNSEKYFPEFCLTTSRAYALPNKFQVLQRLTQLLISCHGNHLEYKWWCDLAECIGLFCSSHGWEAVKDFLAHIFGRNYAIIVEDDVFILAREFFARRNPHTSNFSQAKRPLEHKHTTTVKVTSYVCKNFTETGCCPLKRDCTLQHCCAICLKETGRQILHPAAACKSI